MGSKQEETRPFPSTFFFFFVTSTSNWAKIALRHTSVRALHLKLEDYRDSDFVRTASSVTRQPHEPFLKSAAVGPTHRPTNGSGTPQYRAFYRASVLDDGRRSAKTQKQRKYVPCSRSPILVSHSLVERSCRYTTILKKQKFIFISFPSTPSCVNLCTILA